MSEVVAAHPQPVDPGHEHGCNFWIETRILDGLQPLGAQNRIGRENVKFVLS